MAQVYGSPPYPDPSARCLGRDRRLFWGGAACAHPSELQAEAYWTVENANLAYVPEKKSFSALGSSEIKVPK